MYIFDPLSVASFANIFSHSEGCLFVLFVVSFAVQKLLSFIKSHLFIFVFYFHYSRRWVKKDLLCFMSKSVLPMSSSRSFIVSDLTFRSLIHFEFFCVYPTMVFRFFPKGNWKPLEDVKGEVTEFSLEGPLGRHHRRWT